MDESFSELGKANGLTAHSQRSEASLSPKLRHSGRSGSGSLGKALSNAS
jgi:hypothetical protein